MADEPAPEPEPKTTAGPDDPAQSSEERIQWLRDHGVTVEIPEDRKNAPPAGGAEVAPEDQMKRCADCLFADFANANHNIRFDLGAAPPTFKSVRVGDFEVVRGEKNS